MSIRIMKNMILILFLIALSACAYKSPEQTFNIIRHDPVALRMFISQMPKGAELHTHLSGIPYAEDYLSWAIEDGSCVDQKSNHIVAGPCVNGTIAAAELFNRNDLWNTSVDSLSVRQNKKDNRLWGHNQFFSTFSKFGTAKQNVGRLLAHAAKQAYRDKVQYVEAMISIYGPNWVSPWAEKIVLDGNYDLTLNQLERSGLYNDLDLALNNINEAEIYKKNLLGPSPEGAVLIRYINQIYRGAEPEYVFAQMAWSFELVKRDPRVIAINLVGPEDSPIAVRDYQLHMNMLDFFHKKYPNVPIVLHAGELTGWLSTPSALSNHIRMAILKGHATRIGHGVDIAYEDDALDTMELMRQNKIALEVLLSSNNAILNVSGSEHPVTTYQKAKVPVILSSDDMGVARSTLTNEYVLAVTDQNFDYNDLKETARNSFEFSLLSGESLWENYSALQRRSVCINDKIAEKDCQKFLKENEKAAQQWKLEKRFIEFESKKELFH